MNLVEAIRLKLQEKRSGCDATVLHFTENNVVGMVMCARWFPSGMPKESKCRKKIINK